MFQALKALVTNSPIAMHVAAAGELLRVTISQKQGKRGTPINLFIEGTPEELDRDLPGAIGTAAGEIGKRQPVADQVREQVAAAATTPGKPPRAKKKGTAHKRSVAARAVGERKREKKAKAQELRQAKALKHKASAKPAAKVKLPGAAKTPAAPKARKVSLMSGRDNDDGVKHHANRPDKAACIADYLDSCPKPGDTIKREDFINKKGGTGRRFERLWGMSWNKFRAAAEAARGKKPAAAPAKPADSAKPAQASENPGARARALQDQAERRAVAKETAARGKKETQLSMLPDTWPFKTTPEDVKDRRDKAITKNGFDAYDDQGRYLGYLGFKPELGATIELANVDGEWRVFAIDGCRVMTKALPGLPASTSPDSVAPQASSNSAAPSGAEEPAAAAESLERMDTSKPHPPRVVKDKEGKLIAGGFTQHVKAGQEIELAGKKWLVAEHNERHVTVEWPRS